MSIGPQPVDAWPDGPFAGAAGTPLLLRGTVTGGHAQDTDDWHWQLALHTLGAGEALRLDDGQAAQVTPLDAPLQLHEDDDRFRLLLRLQVARASLAHTARATEATRVVSLHRRESVAVDLIARPLQGPMLLPADARWMAWLLAGRAEARWGDTRWALAVDRPMWLPDDRTHRLRIDGGGEVLLLKIDARDADPLAIDTPC